MEKYNVGDPWPNGVSDGLTLPCHNCKITPIVDYTVTDKEWNDRIPNRFRLGVICIECFIRVYGGNLESIERIQIIGTKQTLICTPSVLWSY